MLKKLLTFALSLFVAGTASASLPYVDSGQWTFNQDVAVQDSIVATTVAYGLQMWDMNDPELPVLLDDFYVDGNNAWAVDWLGDTVYFTTTTGMLYILDASDPADLSELGTVTGLGSNPDIEAVDTGSSILLYSAGNASQDFQVHDVTDPGDVSYDGYVSLSGSTKYLDVDYDDGVAFVVTSNLVYSIDLGSLTVLDTEAPSGTHMDVSYCNGTLAVASRTEGFLLYDAADPSALSLESTTVPSAGNWPDSNDPLPNVRSVIVSNDSLIVVCNDVGPLTYNITTLSSPQLVTYDPLLDETNPLPLYYVFNESVLFNDGIYMAHWGGHTPGAVLADALTDEYVGRTRNYDYCRDVDVAYTMVVGCTGNSGVVIGQLLNTASGPSFNYKSELKIPEVWGVDALQHGTDWYAFVASTLDGLVSVDFTDFADPVKLDDAAVGQARQVLVDWPTAYVVAFSNGISTVDVSDPSDLQVLDTYDVFSGDGPVNLAKVGDLLFVAQRSYGMGVYDVSDPSDIVSVANFDTGYDVNDISVPSTAYAFAVSNSQVYMINIVDPENPYTAGTFGSYVTGIDISDRLYVSRGTHGIEAYELRLGLPVLVDSEPTAKTAYSIRAYDTLHSKFLFVADYAGLSIFEDMYYH